MAGLLMVFLWAYLGAADGTMGVARDRSLEPVVPMGALTMAPDAFGCDPGEVRIPPDNDCVQDYIPPARMVSGWRRRPYNRHRATRSPANFGATLH